MTPSSSQQAPVQKAGEKSTPSSSSSTASGGASRKVQMVSGSASFAEGEARLRPVQMEKESGSAKSALGGAAAGVVAGADKAAQDAGAQAGGAAKEAVGEATQDAKGGQPDAEQAKLEAAGKQALAALKQTSDKDASDTPGNVGQGDAESGAALPEWFMEIQNRLVASTTWGEAEENAQHAIRDYAMYIAKSKSKDGKVPNHIAAFFEYIGRGTKNDDAARKSGNKGSSDLNGAKGAKNWCAGAATQAARIGEKMGREALLAELKSRGLEPNTMPVIFFSNLANLSGSQKAKSIWGGAAYAEPLQPGDRVDFLFDGCQYGGHAVHIVADLGDSFLHVSGNTTRHSAVATGQAKRTKEGPKGFDLGIATAIKTEEQKQKATAHIKGVSFGGGKLVYSIQRYSDPFKALSLLDTDDPKAFEAALKKLCLKRTAPVADTKGAKGSDAKGG
jgi:hypothetical protein